MKEKVQKLVLNPNFRKVASVSILLITVFLFAYYIHKKPELIHSLRHINLGITLVLLALYTVILLTNTFILRWSVELCSRYIGTLETLLLTAYSSLVNFFGPLQSGPGFRAVYLKKKTDVSLKSYGMATLLYYGVFGVINLILLCYGLQPTLAIIALVILVCGALAGGWYLARRGGQQFLKHPVQVSKISLMTVLQVATMAIIFFLELKVVNPHIAFSQALIYTGAANLALFVSLTPGAIGIRESFLLFSTSLHHISTRNIIAASIIDRGVYFLFLGLLFVGTTSFHAGERLQKRANTKPS